MILIFFIRGNVLDPLEGDDVFPSSSFSQKNFSHYSRKKKNSFIQVSNLVIIKIVFNLLLLLLNLELAQKVTLGFLSNSWG